MAFINGCVFLSGSSGTADFTDGTAEVGYRNLDDVGAVDGKVYSYRAESPDHTQWELAQGAYNSGTGKLARTTIYSSSNGDAKVDFSVAPIVILEPLAADFAPVQEFFAVAASDESTAITTGTAKVTFRMPYAFTLTKVKVSLTVASTSGAPQIDVNKNGTSIFSTNPTIDANEKTTATAATPSVLSTTALADDDEITIDIDTAGTGAKGLKVYLIGHQ